MHRPKLLLNFGHQSLECTHLYIGPYSLVRRTKTSAFSFIINGKWPIPQVYGAQGICRSFHAGHDRYTKIVRPMARLTPQPHHVNPSIAASIYFTNPNLLMNCQADWKDCPDNYFHTLEDLCFDQCTWGSNCQTVFCGWQIFKELSRLHLQLTFPFRCCTNQKSDFNSARLKPQFPNQNLLINILHLSSWLKRLSY